MTTEVFDRSFKRFIATPGSFDPKQSATGERRDLIEVRVYPDPRESLLFLSRNRRMGLVSLLVSIDLPFDSI